MAKKDYTVLIVKENPEKISKLLESNNISFSKKGEKPKVKKIKKSVPAC